MCVNFTTVNTQKLQALVDAHLDPDLFDQLKVEAYPLYTAPFIRRGPDGGRTAEPGMFGLLPAWAKDIKFGRRTNNARSETASTKPAFRHAWGQAHFCLIPMAAYFEPNYESGAPVRWRIRRNDTDTFAVAGLWSWWPGRDGAVARASFSLLTVNADQHPVLRRFHAPDDEKRAIVQIAPQDYDRWLSATADTAMQFLQLPDPDVLQVEPAPLPPRVKKAPAADPNAQLALLDLVSQQGS